jgi:hypothetical protein
MAPAAPEILLDERARPIGAQRAVIGAAAVASALGGAWLARALDSDPQSGWWVPIAVGAAIAAGTWWFAMQGTRVVVTADGMLTYALHGRMNLTVPLAAVAVFRPIGQGMIAGIGLELVDVQQVRFLHKGGISPQRMRGWRASSGVDLVLEGFPPELAARLSALRDA